MVCAARGGFAGLAPGRHRIEGFDVLALDIAHKGGRTFGYRIEDGRASIAYLPDHALWLGPGAAAEADSANVRELVTGVDVLIHDAQFLEAERHVAVAYGHSTIEATLALAERPGWAGSSCSITDPTAPTTSWPRSWRQLDGDGQGQGGDRDRDSSVVDPGPRRAAGGARRRRAAAGRR